MVKKKVFSIFQSILIGGFMRSPSCRQKEWEYFTDRLVLVLNI